MRHLSTFLDDFLAGAAALSVVAGVYVLSLAIGG